MHEGGWEPFVHHFSSVLGDVVLQDEETRVSERRGTTPARRERLLCSGTWCLRTKKQGLAVRHHARLSGTAAVLGDVVPQDEETRASER